MSIPHKIELEKKWWHRLTKTIIWTITSIFVLVGLLFAYSLWIDTYTGEFNPYAPLFLLTGPIVYFLLQIFYKKLILYIAFGKEDVKKRKIHEVLGTTWNIKALLQKFRTPIITVLALGLVIFFVFSYFKQKVNLRNIRYDAYIENLQIGSALKLESYRELLGVESYQVDTTFGSITDAKITTLNYSAGDLRELLEKCSKFEKCKKNLKDDIEEMQNIVSAGIEYYQKLKKGVDDIITIRDRANEMNREIRFNKLIKPDPAFPRFTSKQVETLIDEQWDLNFNDFIEQKRSCDEANSKTLGTNLHERFCSTDFMKGMFTFNYTEGEPFPDESIESVCTLEKNYMDSSTCPKTIAKVRDAREKFAAYLKTHENPYYITYLYPSYTLTGDMEDYARSKVEMGYQIEKMNYDNFDDDEDKELIVFTVESHTLEPTGDSDYFRQIPSQFFIVDKKNEELTSTSPENVDLSKTYIAQYLYSKNEDGKELPYKVLNGANKKWIITLSAHLSFDGASLRPGLFTYVNGEIVKYNENMDDAWGDVIHFVDNKIYLVWGCVYDTPITTTKIIIQDVPQVTTKELDIGLCESYLKVKPLDWLQKNLW